VCVAFVFPTVVILYKLRGLAGKIVFQSAYFFVLGIMVELTAVSLNQWYFRGDQYIGIVEIIGVRFPIEEFLWLVFAVPAYICIYEFFADDRK